MKPGLNELFRRLSLVVVAILLGFEGVRPASAATTCLGAAIIIAGTSGNDVLYGTAANDVIYGGDGNDVIYGGGGNDLICGGAGDDSLLGESGNDRLDGGAGVNDNAQFIHSTGPVRASLASGVAIGEGNDTLVNIERLIGSNAADTLIGNASDNVFVGLGGDDTIDGGPGIDTVKYGFLPGPIQANLATGVATGEGRDYLTNIERLQGSQANDTLTGDGGDNILSGRDGNDRLDGGAGKDTVDGGAGTDICIAETMINCEVIADQVNDPATGTSFGCGTPPGGLKHLFQSFTPTVSNLARVELRLRVGGSFPATGITTTIRIRSGEPSGPVIGTATAFVPGPQPSGQQRLVGFNFAPALAITPGSKLVIEWVATSGTVLTWMGRIDNPYSGGSMFGCTGVAVPIDDLNFLTFRR
jgi:Ca2+-binding RTX toxin-like protein